MTNRTEIRFILAGIINTVFGITLGFTFIKYLPFHYSLSLFFATFIGVIFNYFNSSLFVFRAKQTFKSLLFFITNYSFIYFMNIFLIALMVRLFELEEYHAYIIITPLGVLVTYFAQKNFVFAAKRN